MKCQDMNQQPNSFLEELILQRIIPILGNID